MGVRKSGVSMNIGKTNTTNQMRGADRNAVASWLNGNSSPNSAESEHVRGAGVGIGGEKAEHQDQGSRCADIPVASR